MKVTVRSQREVQRVYRWRLANPEKYRKYQRELMRARREAEKME